MQTWPNVIGGLLGSMALTGCSMAADTRSAVPPEGATKPTESRTNASPIACVNFDPAATNGLKTAAAARPLRAMAIENVPAGTVIILEASASHDITPQQAKLLGEHVRAGGSLLLALDRSTGVGPFRLAFMLPTTAWQTLINQASRGECESATKSLSWDAAIFGEGASPLGGVSFYHRLKPLDAVERGIGRYEQFPRTQPYINVPMKAGDVWFTRPLMNRDWRTLIQADDVGRSSLLLSGRYGAGRVAVFASSIQNAPAAMLTPVIDWLSASQAAQGVALRSEDVSVRTQVDSKRRELAISLSNASAKEGAFLVVARVMTWENALMADEQRDVRIAARSSATISIPLPSRSATEYQAITDRDAFILRIGVLCADGSQILQERRVSVDLRPNVNVSLSTDNLWAMPYPFQAPGYDAQDRSFQRRLGTPVMAYAYPQGHPINVSATLTNGLRNVAPMASVRDLTTPENPTVTALNDEIAHAEKGPRAPVSAYGNWEGAKGVENRLSFTFPQPVTLCAVVLNGAASPYRGFPRHNLGSIRIEADAKPIAQASDLMQRFEAEQGLVRIPFAPVQTSRLELIVRGGDAKQAPWIGEAEIQGSVGELPATVAGTLEVTATDPLTSQTIALAKEKVDLAGGDLRQVKTTLSPDVPETGIRPLRLEARFVPDDGAKQTPVSDAAPVVVLKPQQTLEPIQNVDPANDVHLGFIVTRGFRNAFDIGTGNQDMPGSWGTPDDLVWAYAHQLKQTSPNNETKATTLYASEQDQRHYSTPWTRFANGESFFSVATPNFLAKAKQDRRWKDSTHVVFGFSDRWDTGPSTDLMYTWPEIVGFDDWLRQSGGEGLKGKTRREICQEINRDFRAPWLSYISQRYAGDVRTLKSAFAEQGKQFRILAQGIPVLPTELQDELSSVLRGMSNDCTWGLSYEDPPYTTGQEMATLSLNPGWKLAEPLVWGYDSAILNNPHWFAAVSTTEPSRRFQYDRAWRGCIGADGKYRSMHTYGYSMNASVSWCMELPDWQECWRVQERRSLLYPEAPLGVGLLSSRAMVDDPAHRVFSGGGMGGSEADKAINSRARLIRRLQEAGLPISFSSNINNTARWGGQAPLLICGVESLMPDEITALADFRRKGIRVAGLASGGPLPVSVAEMFGVKPDGSPAGATVKFKADNLVLLEHQGWSLLLGAWDQMNAPDAAAVAASLIPSLDAPIRLPSAMTGYGFVMGNQQFVVIEDWSDKPRTAEIRLRATPGQSSVRAADINEHRTIPVRRDGNDWVITVAMRPGDGNVICVSPVQPSEGKQP